MEAYMKDPVNVFQRYLRATEGVSVDQYRWFRYGMMAMALQSVTWMKALEQLPVTTEVGRQEAIVAFQTMLTELGLADEAYETYDLLAEWRRTKFDRLPATEA